jgi:hypothetical protein
VKYSEKDYQTLETPPVDGTDEPDAEKVPGPINIVSDEVEVATEEHLRRVIEEEGKLAEPEIGAYEFDAALSPGEARAASRAPYTTLYPTHFDFRADVARAINRVQAKFPWQTFANTYYMHPPVHGRKYEFVSVDFWGGGLVNGKYAGYRGKPIGASLGQQVRNALYSDPNLPNILWIIWSGKMWTRGWGTTDSPPGPADSDAGHYNHVHITYVL